MTPDTKTRSKTYLKNSKTSRKNSKTYQKNSQTYLKNSQTHLKNSQTHPKELKDLPKDLKDLPTDLFPDIADVLDVASLLKVRQVSRAFQSVAQRRFTRYIAPRLDDIVVSNTNDGLELLRSICHIPSCRQRIRCIEVIGVRQVIYSLRGDRTSLLDFEVSETAKSLWTEIFTLLKDAPNLGSVKLGSRENVSSHGATLAFGGRQLLRMAPRWRRRRRRTGGVRGLTVHNGIVLRHLGCSMAGCMVTMTESGFNLSKVRITIQESPFPDDGQYHTIQTPPREGWQDVLMQCFDYATLNAWDFQLGLDKSLPILPALPLFCVGTKRHGEYELFRDHDFEYRWRNDRCAPRSHCSSCSVLTRPLSTLHFRHLKSVAIDPELLATLQHMPLLEPLAMRQIGLLTGSWTQVLHTLRDLPLHRCELADLLQARSPGKRALIDPLHVPKHCNIEGPDYQK
ncbi:hypothetical protein M011DRAFT_455246 [Sporormia fimetaria CBS 119925]|uniref:F-box domain-containing protein n=1 Tax=Sporormia fimetaria CBS 119925 TaxID=1340428 RepID=A0A6A6VNR2_9PLEO|nr:hypothetical protein M011DRAFT_455246 [Sporormia fimetaria CBS 119925]